MYKREKISKNERVRERMGENEREKGERDRGSERESRMNRYR